ncbi:MAG: SCO family protein, partial [Novosphingobium sp.]
MARPFLLTLALACAVAACGSGGGESPDAGASPPLAGSRIGGEFTLVNAAGKTVRYSDFAGKYRIVYFGYTFCPDACPLDLQRLMQGFARFARDEPAVAGRVQPIFVSIDPARDTPAVVGEYAAAFSPRLIGLTGSEAQVAAAAKAFAAYYTRGEDSAGGGYQMDHSRIAYLMDRDGAPLAMLPVDKGAAAVAQELAQW